MRGIFSRRRFLAATAAAASGLVLAAAAAAADLKVGVGRTVITPQGPIWMSGYASRNHPSQGVIHDLWAKALAIEDPSGGRVVIVTTDLIGLPHELAEEVAAKLKTKHGLERSQIVLNSAHTHSGPVDLAQPEEHVLPGSGGPRAARPIRQEAHR